MISFILANTRAGALIVNRLDYARAFNDEFYGVGCQLLEYGAYDQSEADVIRDLLTLRRQYNGDGVVMLDCGANIGAHVVQFAEHMRGWGQIYAIEAQERIFYALAGNLALHNATNARAIWAAVGPEDSEIEIPEPDYNLASSFGSFELRQHIGTENIGQDINYDKPTSRVPMVRIDSIGLQRCDLIKMDVEGMELEALSGAVETIKAHKPLLFVECIKVDKTQLTKLVSALGYRTFPQAMNLLCVHEDDRVLPHITPDQARAA